MNNLQQCYSCGGEYHPSYMADWTICFSCKEMELKQMGYDYVDSLGIGWSNDDIAEAGGIKEIEKLCSQSR